MSVDSPRLVDSELPAVETLMGPEARGPLDAVLEPLGARTGSFSRRQVTWWPGRSITVRYEVQNEQGEAMPQIVACSGSIPAGAAILESDGVRIGVWALPNDPALPGLASVLDARTLRPMLASLGVTTTRVVPRFRTYRPGRRAVVQVDTDSARIYVKLGRPKDIRRLHDTHRLMAEVLPVPTSLGYDPDLGILVMPSGRGVTLRQALDSGVALPPVSDLQNLLGLVPRPIDDTKTRSPISKLGSLVELLERLVPDQADRLKGLVAAIGEETGGHPVPVHGDFHDGQLLVEGGRVTGLLDVDTHATGNLADDPATMLGHLSSRRPHAPHPERIDQFVAELLESWLARVGVDDLRRRAAAVVLGLATGPFRVQQDDWASHVRVRIGRAEAVLADENPLIPFTGGSHGRQAS
jgi:hypothetical protein